MAAITRPHHTGLQVADLARSVAFYRDVLGFEEVFSWNPQAVHRPARRLSRRPTSTPRSCACPNSDVFLELLEYRNVERDASRHADGQPGHGPHRVLRRRLDALYAELIAKGVASVSPPVSPTIGPNKGGRAVYMIDPDGIRVELITSRRRSTASPTNERPSEPAHPEDREEVSCWTLATRSDREAANAAEVDRSIPFIDPHFHVWELERSTYHWLTDNTGPHTGVLGPYGMIRVDWPMERMVREWYGSHVIKSVHVEADDERTRSGRGDRVAGRDRRCVRVSPRPGRLLRHRAAW